MTLFGMTVILNSFQDLITLNMHDNESLFLLILRHRRILSRTSVSDIRARFAGSVLGLLWVVFYPLLLLGSYVFIYVKIFEIRFGMLDPIEYVALIFCGLIPYIGFSEALGMGVSSVVANNV